mgnify:CR=1 FL=1
MLDRAIIITGFVVMLTGLVWLGLMQQSIAHMQRQLGDMIVRTHR